MNFLKEFFYSIPKDKKDIISYSTYIKGLLKLNITEQVKEIYSNLKKE